MWKLIPNYLSKHKLPSYHIIKFFVFDTYLKHGGTQGGRGKNLHIVRASAIV